MKRITLFFVAVLLAAMSMTASAEGERQHLGFEIGFTRPLLREATTSSANKLSNIVSMNGMKLGFVYDATMYKGLGANIGVYYNVANSYTKWEDGVGLTKYPQTRQQYLAHSIEIPVALEYKFKIADETYLIIYTGPSFEYSFSLRQSSYSKTFDQKVTRVDKNYYELDGDGDGKKDYSQFNTKWGVGGGFQYQNYYLRGGYDFGIMSVYADGYDNVRSFNRHGRFDGWSIRLGIYFFNF